MLSQQAQVRALSKDDKAFIEHCERDHLGYRRDCSVCLSSSIRSHAHVRQKYAYRNAFTLNVDLIGPLKQGEDQLGVARHLLVGVLGVPLFRDGRPRPLAKDQADQEGYQIPAEWIEDAEGPPVPGDDEGFVLGEHEGQAGNEGLGLGSMRPRQKRNFRRVGAQIGKVGLKDGMRIGAKPFKNFVILLRLSLLCLLSLLPVKEQA